jgi:hypothetical protein
VSPFAGGHDAVTGLMVMGRRGGATPHPATELSAASSRFTPPASLKPSTLTWGMSVSSPAGRPTPLWQRRARSPYRKLCIDIQLWLKNADWPRAPPGARWY